MDAIGKRALELCRQFQKTPTRTLAKRLAEEFKPTLSIERARSRIRYHRGQLGKLHKQKASAEKKQAPKMPRSLASSWEPFVLRESRIGVISDLHVPFHDQVSIAITVEKLQKLKIDCLLLNGDYGDWYSISRWLKDPRKRDLKAELTAQQEGLKYLRQKFKKARIVYKNGNHEDRWEHYIWNHAPEISEFENVQLPVVLGLEDLGIEHVKNERPILAGDLSIFHGHEIPGGGGQNPAKSSFAKLGTQCLVGHSHRTSAHIEQDWKKQRRLSYSTGCLCDLSPQYARINKWNHGFAVVKTASKGQFEVTNFAIHNGEAVKQ